MIGFLLPPQLPHAGAALRDAKEGSPDAQWVAAIALGQVDGQCQDDAVRALKSLMESPLEEIRAQAVEGLSEQARRGATIDEQLIARAIDDPSPAVRAAALDAVVETNIPVDTLHLEQRLADPDPSVRIAAAVVATDLDYRPALPQLKRLLSDPVAIVRLQAAIALASFGDSSGADELVSGLTLPPREAIEAARVIGHLGSNAPDEALNALGKMAAKRFGDVSLKAAAAVSLFCCTGGANGAETIAKLLSARNPDTKLTILSSIAGLPLGTLIPQVAPLLHDREPLVVSSAIATIGVLAECDHGEAIATLEREKRRLSGGLRQELEECLHEIRLLESTAR